MDNSKKQKIIKYVKEQTLNVLLIIGLVFIVYYVSKKNTGTNNSLFNKVAPSFIAQMSNDNIFNLNDEINKNKWIILNFWQESCSVCKEDLPEMEKFYYSTKNEQQYPAKFVSINISDNKNIVLLVAKAFHLSFPIVLDINNEISTSYNITGTPTTYFINSAGIIKYVQVGGIDSESIYKILELINRVPEEFKDSVNK